MKKMKAKLLVAARMYSIVSLVLFAAGAHAQPENGAPLKIVVPFAAGSTIDALARLVALKLPDHLHKGPVIVENRSGAGGLLGTSVVAKSRPDGKTIVLQANGLTTTPAVRNDLPFNVLTDLAPVILVGYAPYAFVVPADSPYNTLTELLDAARNGKGDVSFGTSGPGSQSDFVIAQMAKSAKVNFLKVPYKGQADIMLGVMGGQIQLGMINMPSAVKQRQAGRVKILATITSKRTATTPEVQTLAEAGYPGVNEAAWYGFLAPAATPTSTLTELSKGIAAVLAEPDAKVNLQEMGIEVIAGSPAAFADRIATELARYKKIALEENIRAE